MASTFIQEHNRLFSDLTAALSRDLARLSSDANGGRSILFVILLMMKKSISKKRNADLYKVMSL